MASSDLKTSVLAASAGAAIIGLYLYTRVEQEKYVSLVGSINYFLTVHNLRRLTLLWNIRTHFASFSHVQAAMGSSIVVEEIRTIFER